MTECIGVDKTRLGGGLTLLWKDGLTLTLISKSPNHIDTLLSLSNNNFFHFIGFYGNLNAAIREHSWTLLKRLKQAFAS